jgi:hypothetical protein
MAAPTLTPPATPAWRMPLLIVLACLLPVLTGGGLYLAGWRPAATGNHGELVLPPQALPLAALGAEVAGKAEGKWLLVIAGDAPCAAACTELAGRTRAVQVSLNRDMGRLRRLVLAETPTPELATLQAAQPDLLVAAPDAAWRAALAAGGTHRLFVLDPAGRLMMQYAPGADPKGVRADLERLLKSSWIG